MEWTSIGPFGDAFVGNFEGAKTARGIDLELPGGSYSVGAAARDLRGCIVLFLDGNGGAAELVARGRAVGDTDIEELKLACDQFSEWSKNAGCRTVGTEEDLARVFWDPCCGIDLRRDCVVIACKPL